MTTVITYGTFDLFHQGHYNILKRARERGDYLIVGVTSESYDIERGKLNVRDSLPARIQNVLDTGFADKIIIEEYQGQKINDIIKYNVDILVIGSDWLGKFDYLKEYCDVQYLERTKGVSSTQIRSETGKLYRVGIAVDSPDDGLFVSEARYVSGVHVESVYSSDGDLARSCTESWQLASAYSDLDAFLEDVDIVYIHTDINGRAELARRAIARSKHVICDNPVSLDPQTVSALYAQAHEAGVAFCENIRLPYLRAFTQLVWLLHGGIIGSVERVEIKAPCNDVANPLSERLILSVYAANRLLNTKDPLKVATWNCPPQTPARRFVSISTQNQLATIELDSSEYAQSGIRIHGSGGMIIVPDDWWNMGFFEIRSNQHEAPQRYSANFEGSGMRYLLQEYLITINAGKMSQNRFSENDSLAILSVLDSITEDGR